LTSGIHLIARIRSPTLQRMSKRAFHMLKWAPSKHGTGAGSGLRIHQMFSIFLHHYFPPFLQRRAVHFSTRIQQVPPPSHLPIFACIRVLLLLTSPCALQRVRRAAGQQPVHALLAASGYVRQASVRRLIPPVNTYMLPCLSFCTVL
jgi:hypothetical protein